MFACFVPDTHDDTNMFEMWNQHLLNWSVNQGEQDVIQLFEGEMLIWRRKGLTKFPELGHWIKTLHQRVLQSRLRAAATTPGIQMEWGALEPIDVEAFMEGDDDVDLDLQPVSLKYIRRYIN